MPYFGYACCENLPYLFNGCVDSVAGEENLRSRGAGAFHGYVNISKAWGAVIALVGEASASKASSAPGGLALVAGDEMRVRAYYTSGGRGAGFFVVSELLAFMTFSGSVV